MKNIDCQELTPACDRMASDINYVKGVVEGIKDRYELDSVSITSSSDHFDQPWIGAHYSGRYFSIRELGDIESSKAAIDAELAEERPEKIAKLKAELAELEGVSV